MMTKKTFMKFKLFYILPPVDEITDEDILEEDDNFADIVGTFEVHTKQVNSDEDDVVPTPSTSRGNKKDKQKEPNLKWKKMHPVPSTSSLAIQITQEIVRPFPKAQNVKKRVSRRKKLSKILTQSSEKDAMEKEYEERRRKKRNLSKARKQKNMQDER
ncbi:hypothetical protein ILUMI_04575 [Ignelater luminosus]|uniref:Uncharacterized protein n=1 Tax=Ignelater luminosus TaxID=2038154 RepID=A0A8K0D8P9_IGNLU|nr:hypothetical protein ILUMI_04575 [Ignelater luminosus]